jgi:plasmid replication initiation protein
MSDEVVKSLSNRAVTVQSNSMINSKYSLDPTQQKLILLAIAQIKTADENFFKYSCSVAELEERLGVQIQHKQLKESCLDLFKKPLYIKKPRGWIACNWFSAIEYFDDEARIEFEISPTLTPYLLNLKKNFTTFNIEQAIKFSGKYTTRFYQFLIQAQHQQAKKRTFALEELYELLQLPTTLTTSFTRFTKKVLEPSLAEINVKSDIKTAYEITKKLRKKVLEITIYFDFKDVLEAKTQRATAAKNFKKYVGREFIYFGALLKIDYIQENEEKQRIEAIYTDPKDGQQSRADFDSLEHLEQATRKAKELKADMKSNPDRYEKKDRDLSSLF